MSCQQLLVVLVKRIAEVRLRDEFLENHYLNSLFYRLILFAINLKGQKNEKI